MTTLRPRHRKVSLAGRIKRAPGVNQAHGLLRVAWIEERSLTSDTKLLAWENLYSKLFPTLKVHPLRLGEGEIKSPRGTDNRIGLNRLPAVGNLRAQPMTHTLFHVQMLPKEYSVASTTLGWNIRCQYSAVQECRRISVPIGSALGTAPRSPFRGDEVSR